MLIESQGFEAGLEKMLVRVTESSRGFIREAAHLVERQAKQNATGGRHKAGTPTPATPGSGPAIITGTLRRSIRSQVEGTKARIGPTVVYARRVEMEFNYPFLIPAAKFVTDVALPALARKWYTRALRG